MDKHSRKNGFNAALVGKESNFIDFSYFEKPVHKEIITPLLALKECARAAGFDLKLASGFRNFEQQLFIWNEKAQGRRLVLDANEKPLDISRLNSDELLFALLRWSALPGTSRHHWGTDVDIYDMSVINDGYQLKLTVEETVKGGVFEKFYLWLDVELREKNTGFFRPYANDHGGVSPEPWHLSYLPLAKNYEKELTIEHIFSVIKETDIALKDEIIKNLDEIFYRFVKNSK